ncbi:MAG: sigma factor-like helix-turn-helix DNA-binding protein, partial [Planctomycetota bacterium]|nr:sigma factor-like helix-turn-helix DNA-binding protein [Planctomycetota bacterium]
YPFCHYAMMNRLRKEVRRPKLVDIERTQHVGASNDQVDFSHVHRALDELPEDEAQTVRTKYFDGLTFREIAQLSGTTLSMAKRRYYRGLARLRISLAPLEERRDDE